MQRVTKPKTQKGKRILEGREPKLVEDTKQTLFIRGKKTSNVGQQILKDFAMLKKPHAVFYSRKNDIKPIEDASQLEFYMQKSDTPLFLFASHNKKRPHNLVLGRTYDDHVLDMVELGAENYKSLQEFKVPKMAVGTKPLLTFSGELFYTDDDHKRLRNLLLDFFRGPQVEAIRLTGLEYVLSFTAVAGQVLLRSFRVLMKKSGTRVPRIELEEIGPSADFVIRRTKLASDDLYKLSLRQPKQLKIKKTKNIEKDELGTKFGRIHMTKQNLGSLQTRKMKALKVKKNKRNTPAK